MFLGQPGLAYSLIGPRIRLHAWAKAEKAGRNAARQRFTIPPERYYLPILNILVPQTGQVPWVAGFLFFIVTFTAFLISLLALHFTQYASTTLTSLQVLWPSDAGPLLADAVWRPPNSFAEPTAAPCPVVSQVTCVSLFLLQPLQRFLLSHGPIREFFLGQSVFFASDSRIDQPSCPPQKWVER